jgi:hypothetical protein
MRAELTEGSIRGMSATERDRRVRMIAWELGAAARRHPRSPVSEECVRALAHEICRWTQGGEYQRPARPEWQSHESEFRFDRQLGADAASIAERLSRSGVSSRMIGRGVAPGMLDGWNRALEEMRCFLKLLPREPRPQGRGPKIDTWRVRFAAVCGAILVDHELPIGRSRAGLFADVVTVALAAAAEPVPEDTYALVDQALTLMEQDARSVLAVHAAADDPASKLNQLLRSLGQKLVPDIGWEKELQYARRVLASARRRGRVVPIRKKTRK